MEPKFVPYEPYKGAVASMEEKKGKRPERKSIAAADPVESEVFLKEEEVISRESSEMRSELEQNYRCMLDIKEKEIQSLKEKLDQSDKQLKIQTKVNEEVKRLEQNYRCMLDIKEKE